MGAILMGRVTKIGWCHHTFNGVHGCAHAILSDGTESPGCQHCYAEAGSKRNPQTLGIWGEEGTRVLAAERAWKQLAVWHRAAVRAGELRRVFCYSIGDVFESPVSVANKEICIRGRTLLFAAIERLRPWLPIEEDDGWNTATRQNFESHGQWRAANVPCGLIFMLLTKRPENVRRMVPPHWLVTDAPQGSNLGWPQHVWLGTSIENQQAADERIPRLLDVPGVPVPFLSCEPLLEQIDIEPYIAPGAGARGDYMAIHGHVRPARIGWVIAGGESGKRARDCDIRWIRDLRDQCQSAGVPFWTKQLGTYGVDVEFELELRHPKGGDPAEWPEDLRVQEVPDA